MSKMPETLAVRHLVTTVACGMRGARLTYRGSRVLAKTEWPICLGVHRGGGSRTACPSSIHMTMLAEQVPSLLHTAV